MSERGVTHRRPVPAAAPAPASSGLETRTLLYADLEGSTRLLAALGDEYAVVLGTYRRVVQQAIATHGGTGQETEGDGFVAAFSSARDGVAAALDAQLALQAQDWPQGAAVRARIGLHTGDVQLIDGELVGLAVHETARIMAAGHGGQVIVSPWIRQLAATSLPRDISLRSLGRHRLKDIIDPVELFQACHPQLPGDFPPPRANRAVMSLPVPRTSLVGRDEDVMELRKLLSVGRLLTLTGVGGTGKTRLAIEVAAHDAERHPDGVFFVDLAPVADPNLVPAAVAAAANVQGEVREPRAMLLSYLGPRRVLLVLDNCEHLVVACAGLVDQLLSTCPSLTILATSREALQVDGEQTFRVPSLDCVHAESPAVELFVTRARAVRSGFTLTDVNRDDITGICQRLDGIPLAIELAAARVDQLTVADIARRLDHRFELLGGPRRDRTRRHQTLQAAMEWSWALLTDKERTFLRRLAVFVGPFTVEAAEAVGGLLDAVDLLASLVAKSLVTLDDSEPAQPYRLLETVRLFAQDRLEEAGEAAERRDAHRDWYLARIAKVAFDDWLVWNRGLFLSEIDNLRAAMDWCEAQNRPDLLAGLVLPAVPIWALSPASADEAQRWLQRIAGDERVAITARADALAALAIASLDSGDFHSGVAYGRRSLAVDSTDRVFKAVALLAVMRPGEAADVAARHGAHSTARYLRAWAAYGIQLPRSPLLLAVLQFSLKWTLKGRLEKLHRAALQRFECVIADLDPDRPGWDWLYAYAGAALAHLALDEPQQAFDAAELLRRGSSGASLGKWIPSYDLYWAVIEAMAVAALGRPRVARMLLADPARAALRERYPLFANDCLVALAYITASEGDAEAAARLLQAVLLDGRVRTYPMLFFTVWLLERLHADVDGDRMDPQLPTVREFVARVLASATGTTSREPTAAARIDEALADFVAGGARPTSGDAEAHLARADEEWRAGRSAESAAAAASARQVAEDLGDVTLVGRAVAALRRTGALVPGAGRGAGEGRPGGLSTRELEVAALVADGRSNGEIAHRLHLSEHTVAKHVGNILGKLDLRSRAQIARWAAENGVVPRA